MHAFFLLQAIILGHIRLIELDRAGWDTCALCLQLNIRAPFTKAKRPLYWGLKNSTERKVEAATVYMVMGPLLVTVFSISLF